MVAYSCHSFWYRIGFLLIGSFGATPSCFSQALTPREIANSCRQYRYSAADYAACRSNLLSQERARNENENRVESERVAREVATKRAKEQAALASAPKFLDEQVRLAFIWGQSMRSLLNRREELQVQMNKELQFPLGRSQRILAKYQNMPVFKVHYAIGQSDDRIVKTPSQMGWEKQGVSWLMFTDENKIRSAILSTRPNRATDYTSCRYEFSIGTVRVSSPSNKLVQEVRNQQVGFSLNVPKIFEGLEVENIPRELLATGYFDHFRDVRVLYLPWSMGIHPLADSNRLMNAFFFPHNLGNLEIMSILKKLC
jgi:hypothetical protein